jgi:phosphoribosylaminoimidazole-succinocarboxamide synthase
MVKNQPFESPIITPTTKSETHDELISSQEIVSQGLVEKNKWAEVEEIALALFARGTELAAQRGLILVDTKYEMGLDKGGRITIADEIHTPDSSRFWIKDTYEDRFSQNEEPESLDKEFLRLWLRDRDISDEHIPDLDDEIRVQVAERYLDLYERITGEAFDAELSDEPVAARIERNIEAYFK